VTETRVVVLGGFGNFGARICRRVALESGIDVVATGRQVRDGASGTVRGARLDLNTPTFPLDLAALQPDIVIHCAGPFQDQDYRVAEAALNCRAHYVDLADGRAFVARLSAERAPCQHCPRL
jgi:saccharopine dehydrogenase-like NADP-dependent oxidoreductase